MSMSDTTRLRWETLLRWLRGHGMKVGPEELLVECKARSGAGNGLFSSQTCPPLTPLFTVPGSALMNVKTLAYHYTFPPGISLTGTQLVSLHLFLHRPPLDQESLDPLFGPYISILPRDFESHPLTWLVKRDFFPSDAKSERLLLLSLPPSAIVTLENLGERFRTDWQAVRQHMIVNTDIRSISGTKSRVSYEDAACMMDFVWAWLNVNTRCIYHRLKPSRSDPDNFTLCPILDFANHTPNLPHMSPIRSDAKMWNTSPRSNFGDGFTLLSPENIVTERGQELYLTYGAHCNQRLFIEYGFVNEAVIDDQSFDGEIDVQDVMERIVVNKGANGAWIKDLLEAEGYWGDWTVHASPKPAHPSFRLVTALRLCHVTSPPNRSVHCAEVEAWRATLLGRKNLISEGNESAWRQTLLQICQELVDRATAQKITTAARPWPSESAPEWIGCMRTNIIQLWDEEARVASVVAQSILDGEEF